MTGEVGDRKGNHLALCAREEVGFRGTSTYWNRGPAPPRLAPEIAVDEEIDLRTHLLGKVLRAPIVIAAMTGGAPRRRGGSTSSSPPSPSRAATASGSAASAR